MSDKEHFDVIIIGAGAAGLMCAIESARRGRKTLVFDHAAKPAEKVRISGGGKCNFTHLGATPKAYLSDNPHFCISALKRFTPFDFLERVKAHHIDYYEKTEGQLFCKDSAHSIINMLLNDYEAADGYLRLNTEIQSVEKSPCGFDLQTSKGDYRAQSLVIATGGLSIPKMGATPFAYEIAQQFGHTIIKPRAGLVPFTLNDAQKERLSPLSGVSLTSTVRCGKVTFKDGLLFTHRGLSGPVILQISSYWHLGESVEINLLPALNVREFLKAQRQAGAKKSLLNTLSGLLPERLAELVITDINIDGSVKIADLSNASVEKLWQRINAWTVTPHGSEGYRTAEVTVGGVDTTQLSSKTMESQLSPNLYFIGECVDVTGWLGGYNFQWAWSSGWAAGQAV